MDNGLCGVLFKKNNLILATTHVHSAHIFEYFTTFILYPTTYLPQSIHVCESSVLRKFIPQTGFGSIFDFFITQLLLCEADKYH